MSWNIKIDKKVAFNVGYGAGKLFRKLQLFEMFWHAEGMKTTYTRTGKKLTNSVFDIGGGCPKVGPVALKRKLLSAYWHEGKCYEFNFSKFWTFTRTKFDCQETDTQIIWHVEQKTWRNRMVTDITCDKKDMLFVNYEAPNGKKLHNRLWNGGNGKGTVKLYRDNKIIDEVVCENVGCEYGEYDS